MECDNCGTIFKYRENLVRHLRVFTNRNCVTHRRPRTSKTSDFEPERLHFQTESQFESWKLDVERKTCSLFVPKRGNYKTKTSLTKYFICNRSGFFKERVENRKRRLKSQGTGKINGTCPAFITIKIDTSGHVMAEYVLMHNHSMEPQHLRIQKQVKDEIAAALKEGLTRQQILDQIRDSSLQDMNTIDRISILGRKDLLNIARDYKIENHAQNLVADLMNLYLWVQEKFEGNENPVLFFKQPGDLDYKGLLADEDFAVIMMTNFQKRMLLSIGNDQICVDETLGTHCYSFQLITLLTVDVSGKAFPFAFCMANRKTSFVYSLFFRSIREYVGSINCKVFMSNDEPTSYNSWCEVMDEKPRHHFLYVWRVLDNWKNNLSKCPCSVKKRSEISKLLRILLRKKYVKEFEVSLESFIQRLRSDPDVQKFHDFFISSYVDRPQCWALCYRDILGTNTNNNNNNNNNLELMHKVLRQAYLEGAVKAELNPTLDALIAVIRDSVYSGRNEIKEEMRSYFMKRIRESHESSCLIVLSSIMELNESKWELSFESADGETYTVEKRKEKIEKCDCQIACEVCNICIHAYLCSCYDSTIAINICEHVHAIVAFQTSLKIENLLADDMCTVNEIEIDDYADIDDREDRQNDVKHLTKKPPKGEAIPDEDAKYLTPSNGEAVPNLDTSESTSQKIENFALAYRSVSSLITEEDNSKINRYLDKMLTTCSKYCDPKYE